MISRLLVVDLGRRDIQTRTIPPEYVRDFIGGSGLAVRLLWDHLDPTVGPLDPASPLLWLTGPLTGTTGPATGRSVLCARSPQTGLWGESNIGGLVGAELRFAGFDGVLVTGRADAPVVLWIHDGQAELRDASHLWGQADTAETQLLVRRDLGAPDIRVACIGLAGENEVPCAAVIADHGRAAGRTGMGAVMGSKRLKALAVRGSAPIPYARPDDYKQARTEANRMLVDETMTAVFRDTGTAGAADYLEMLGDMPQKYWTQDQFDGAYAIGGASMAEKMLVGKSTCHGCVIACGRVVNVADGPYATQGDVKGPEYETIAAFGSQLLVDDLAVITALGNRCDALGLDTISLGCTIGLAYLLFDRGLLSAADTGGLELRWGDASPCFDLIEQTARRTGLGAWLAQGSQALADHFGAPELAVQVHGLEVPMHDPRAMSGMALVYLTSPRGACHNQSDYYFVELGNSIDELGLPMTERLQDAGKGRHVARHQDWRTLCNSLVMCLFAAVQPSTVAKLLGAATGQAWSVEELLRAGQRTWNLKRAFNGRLGLTRAGERLPWLLRQPLPAGGQAGHVPDVERMLREYYEARGWDPTTGQPTRQTLASLGLDFVSA